MSMIGCVRFATADELARLLAAPRTINDFLDEDPAREQLAGDVDKAWHGIHFLLTGTAWEGSGPAAFLLQGGVEVGEEDVGYGPARAFSPAETRAIADALDALPPEELRPRFDPARMAELDLYPSIWTRPPEEDDPLGYLLAHYAELRRMVRTAAGDGLGMLVYLT